MRKDNETYSVGLIWPGDEHSVEIMQDAEGNFITDEKQIKDWVYCLNNPWSGTSMEYEIYPNYQNADEWIARKKVIVYDSLDACIAARGSTPKEALDNLELFILEVTEQYYVEEEEEEDE